MSKIKLTSVHRAVILAAAARSASNYLGEQADADGAAAAADRMCAPDYDALRDAFAAGECARRAEARYAPELTRLDAMSAGPAERLRRHVIRDLAASPRLRSLAEGYLRRVASPAVGGTDPREGGLVITSCGPDWRWSPAVHLAA